MSLEFPIIKTLILRELKRVAREPGRILGILAQPLLFWIILGLGFGENVRLEQGMGKNYMEFFFPSMLTMNVLFTSLFASMSLIEDKKNGFLRAVYVKAKNPYSVFLGKLGGLSLVVFFQTLILFAFAPLAGISLLSMDWSLVIFTLFAGCLLLVSLNFCGAWILDSTAAYHGLMNLLLFPLWMIAGTLFPLPRGGAWENINYVNPFFYLGEGLRIAIKDPSSVSSVVRDSSLQFSVIGLSVGTLIVLFIAWLVLKVYKVELE